MATHTHDRTVAVILDLIIDLTRRVEHLQRAFDAHEDPHATLEALTALRTSLDLLHDRLDPPQSRVA